MTQPLLLAQTGASNQGANLLGSASALDVKWKWGTGKIDPSAGIAAPKADLAGKKADFAQALRDKKEEAAGSESSRDTKEAREPAARSEENRVTAKKPKRADEKRKPDDAASDRAADKADGSDRGDDAKPVSDTETAKTAKKSPSDATEAEAKSDQSPVDQAVTTAPTPVDVSTKAEQIAATAAQAEQVTNQSAAANTDQKRAPNADQQPQQLQQTSEAKPAAQVVGSAAPNLAAAASASKAKVGVEAATQTSGISARAEVTDKPEDDGAQPIAGVTQAQASGKISGPSLEKIPGNSKSKGQTNSQPAPEAGAEPVKAASESGAQVRATEAKGEREASDNQGQPDFVPAPTKEPAPAPQLSGQAPRAEPSPAVSQSVDIAKPAPATQVIDATVGTPRVEAVQGVQTTPSSEMLRALAPAHSPSNINAAPQSAQTNAAATNQDYQRLLGQQVERGIAQAIQQASAATDAMVMGTGAVVLRLNPANLGQLKVQIKFESGSNGVKARFEASSSRAKGILGDSIESLKTALEGRGLRVDEVVVAQSPRLPEPGVGGYTPDLAQNGQQGAGNGGAGFANQHDQAAPFSFGAPPASGDSRQSAAEAGNDIPIGGLGEQPVWFTGAAGWTVDASGNIRVDALV